jgi:drug/metabolite transporter (DMT)-like permease
VTPQTGTEIGRPTTLGERLAKGFLALAGVLLAGAILLTLPHLTPWLVCYPEAALLFGALLCLVTALLLRDRASAGRGH